MGEFTGKVAVVTGGSLGIGQAVVRRLAGAGAAVVFCGHEPGPVAAAEAALRADGLAVTSFVTGAEIRVDGGLLAVNPAALPRE